MLRERITPPRALGLALIAAGGLLVDGGGLWGGAAGDPAWKGNLLFIGVAFC